jgi:hypothetical protein
VSRMTDSSVSANVRCRDPQLLTICRESDRRHSNLPFSDEDWPRLPFEVREHSVRLYTVASSGNRIDCTCSVFPRTWSYLMAMSGIFWSPFLRPGAGSLALRLDLRSSHMAKRNDCRGAQKVIFYETVNRRLPRRNEVPAARGASPAGTTR